MSMMGKSSKKVAIVTGCSSGMGRAMAHFLSEKDFLVYAFSSNPDELDSIKNINLIPIKVDLKDIESIKDAIKPIQRVDLLINNAGYGLLSTIEDVTEEQMIEQFQINLFGAIRMCKVVIPLMRREQKGIIINISSFLGKIGLPLFSLYNSSKYALEGVTDSLRYELRDFGIRVHSIMPGFFDTNFVRKNLVINQDTLSKKSPYKKLVNKLVPTIKDEINHGNDPKEIAQIVWQIINSSDAKARVSAGEKAKKFIPMRRELSDEDFERRVLDYYGLK